MYIKLETLSAGDKTKYEDKKQIESDNGYGELK